MLESTLSLWLQLIAANFLQQLIRQTGSFL